MVWVYIAAAIFGGAFVLPMVIGGLDLDTDIDLGGDADFDVDVDVDLGDTGGVGDFLASLVSFRSLVFGSAFFGIGGLALTLFDSSTAAALIGAIVLGVFAALTDTTAMRWLKRSGSTSHLTMADMQGSIAEVVVPFGPNTRGRVRAQIGAQTEYFTAMAFRDDLGEFDIGDQVVVVELDNGAAKVSRLTELDT